MSTLGRRAEVINLKDRRGAVYLDVYPEGVDRPKTRGDCMPGGSNAARPCPFVSCRMHLYLDVRPNGNITLNYPDHEPQDLTVSCALDVAADGEHTLEQVGHVLKVTRERARQIETGGARRLRAKLEMQPEIQDLLSGGQD